jgi:hypothetical protein
VEDLEKRSHLKDRAGGLNLTEPAIERLGHRPRIEVTRSVSGAMRVEIQNAFRSLVGGMGPNRKQDCAEESPASQNRLKTERPPHVRILSHLLLPLGPAE